ncbi:centrosomal protein of 131 kDa isoform X2 [Sitodiplosis mosellana]|uniref:centrosomal protein of 131 kDa isoform X2 n=1 Tax=Sitodiplosis mosellana TaxID=263140 RepID=UPI002444FA7A|nr:centrosomal protein of 131 kDa isoform X2 [Sitodiplosis mosellana]
MELALHGSQINLATRDKATAAIPVNYPIFLKRPGSASVTLTTPSAQLAATNKILLARAHSLQCLQQKQQTPSKFYRRAASADCGKYQRKAAAAQHSKTSPHLSSNKSICNGNSHKEKRALSSSSLYRFLLSEPIKRNTWMSNEHSKTDSPAKLAEDDDGSDANVLSKQSKNSGEDTSDDSPSSIAEEIGDNDNDTTNDDEIDHIMERDSKLEQIPTIENENAASSRGSSSSSSSTTITVPPQSNIAKDEDATSIRPKSVGTSRPKCKADAKQKATVIKAKTSSSVNSNNKLKLAKSSGKQVSILQTDGGREKRLGATMTTSSPSSSVDGGGGGGGSSSGKSKPHEMKSAYVPPPASPTASGFNTLKADLPGRVSFSKNDVYEIDYSDIENDTDTSRSLDLNEPFRKKNVHFEDEYFDDDDNDVDGRMDDTLTATTTTHMDVKKHTAFNQTSMHRNLNTAKEISESSNLLTDDKEYCPLKCSSLRCKADMRLDVLPEDNENGSTTQPNDSSEKIIEEYKREIESINRQHERERRWNESKINGDATATYSDYLNGSPARSERKESEKQPKDEWHSGGSDSWSSPNHESTANLVSKTKVTTTTTTATTASNTSDESPTRDSASTVINNYLKITNQKSIGSSKPSSATIKLKTTKKLATPSNRKIKSAQATTACDAKPTTANRLTKAKSVGHLQRVTDIKLNEFQIDKVESWMSTHEDTFSDTGLNSFRRYGKFGSSSNLDYKKTWRETPTSKTDDEGNYSLDDQVDNTSMDGSIGGGIELVLKKLEGRRMQISFDPIKSATSAPSLSAASEAFQHKSCSGTSNANLNEHSNKIKEIYQYLDEVDHNCDRTINNVKQQKMPDADFQTEIDYNIGNDTVGDVPKLSELMLLSSEQLARKVIGLSLRTNELTNAIQLSKDHMDKIRSDNQKTIRLEKQMGQARLKEQKNHYETIVTRHQEFIEQLLKDKASLCEKVSAMTRRLESQSIAAEHKLQNEIQRIKETALAAEKIRRERWVRENTKKIKELTVKGLEQEISKITCNHQKEITELKRQHQEEILNAIEEARQKHESLEMGIRETYAKDREVAIEKERNAIRDRFEKQMELEQRTFEDAKNRILSEFSAEKDRLLKEIQHKEQELDAQREKLLRDKKETAEHLNREFNEKVRMIEKRNQCEIESISKQFESDFAIWKREQETTFKLRQIEEANSIRQQCRAERDKQIDSIVAKIDEETLIHKQEFEAKFNRLKSQHESELREMERSERQTREKYVETRSKLAQVEGEVKNLHATINQLEMQLAHTQKMCDNFMTEKEHFKDAVRKERDEEIQEIHKRVQSAIEKKDGSLEVIIKENASLKDRCIKLEAIVRQQRKDYCIK